MTIRPENTIAPLCLGSTTVRKLFTDIYVFAIRSSLKLLVLSLV